MCSKMRSSVDPAVEQAVTANDLLIGDLVKHLSKWAMLEQDERTGNPSLSQGLTLLVECLKRHQARPVSDLAELELHRHVPRTREARKPLRKLPEHVDSLDWDQVIAILDNEDYQKKQLVELGERRLGIPRSRLSRLKREDAIASIRAAIDNERSLVAIGYHARLVGEQRRA